MDSEHPINLFAEMNINSDGFFQILESHRKSCQREGRWDEAELTRLRILELRAQEQQIKKSQVNKRHQDEKSKLLEAHKTEVERLNEEWESCIMPIFEDSARNAISETREKHKRELESLRDRQEGENERLQAHPPTTVLTLRNRLETLALAGKYNQAKKIRIQLQQEEDNWQKTQFSKLNEKWAEQIEKLMTKQDKDLNFLTSKLSKQKQLKIAQWNKELDVLRKRYNNIRSELESQHAIEKKKLSKEFEMKRLAMSSYTKTRRK